MKKIVAVGIFFILALGLTGCNWFQPAEPTVEQPTVTEEPAVIEEPEETPTDVTEPTEPEEEVEKIVDPLGTGYPVGDTVFVLENGTEISHLELSALLNEKELVGLAAIDDPENKSVIYFFTRETGTEPVWHAVAHRLYKYNFSSEELEEVYKSEEYETERFSLIGREGNKILVSIMGFDNSPGPGWSHWLGGGNIHYINLDDIEAGLKKYTVPEYKEEEEKLKVEELMGELFE
jgi:hypothetical protein